MQNLTKRKIGMAGGESWVLNIQPHFLSLGSHGVSREGKASPQFGVQRAACVWVSTQPSWFPSYISYKSHSAPKNKICIFGIEIAAFAKDTEFHEFKYDVEMHTWQKWLKIGSRLGRRVWFQCQERVPWGNLKVFLIIFFLLFKIALYKCSVKAKWMIINFSQNSFLILVFLLAPWKSTRLPL